MSTFKVVFIGGWGRSGSTLIGNILGQYDGFCSVGEVKQIWNYGFNENRICGCGKDFNKCPFWNSVVLDLLGKTDKLDPQLLANYHDRYCRSSYFAKLSSSSNRSPELIEYLNHLENLYTGITSQSGCQFIVDTSKHPSYALALSLLPSCELHIIHLVRDPRAVAFSWQRRKLQSDGHTQQYMPQYSAVKSTLLWSMWNISFELLQKRSHLNYLRLRYEDFVHSPMHTIRLIMANLSQPPISAGPFINDHSVSLRPTHTIAGNPNRFTTGAVSIHEDDQWKTQLPLKEILTIETISWMLLRRYGYT